MVRIKCSVAQPRWMQPSRVSMAPELTPVPQDRQLATVLLVSTEHRYGVVRWYDRIR